MIPPNFSQLGLRPRRLRIKRYHARFRTIMVNFLRVCYFGYFGLFLYIIQVFGDSIAKNAYNLSRKIYKTYLKAFLTNLNLRAIQRNKKPYYDNSNEENIRKIALDVSDRILK